MGVVCVRAKPVGAAASRPEELERNDIFNAAIVEAVNRSGRSYLNQTKLCGRTAIRLGLGNILTTEKHVRAAWQLIQETAQKPRQSEL